MKKAKRRPTAKAHEQAAPAAARQSHAWFIVAGVLGATFAVLEVYSPAINGPFLFDDKYLPFTDPSFSGQPLSAWISGVRPLLMFTYWFNYSVFGTEPLTYHILNVLFHLAGGAMVWLIVRKLLHWSGSARRPGEMLAVFAAGLFLLHPLNTEAVSYVASRSENLSVFLMYAAFAVFLYRRSSAITVPEVVVILLLFAGAVTTKEHTAVLPALLLLTDYYWNPGFSLEGIRRNWRLYFPMAIAGIAGAAFIWRVLAAADTAGFSIAGLPPDKYFLTQCRAVWVYLRMFVLPYGQSADHDFRVSASWADVASLLGLAGLLGVGILAWILRKRYPLASFGAFTFILLIAPTSSIVPIKDVLVERRLYLPLIGLLLVVVDLILRLKISRSALVAGLACVLMLLGILTYRRNLAWADPMALWGSAIETSPRSWRAHFQLAYAYYEVQRCSEAAERFAKAAELGAPDYRLLVDWALALDCAGRPDEALANLEQAAKLERSAHVYSLIGMIHGKQGRREQALAALQTAESIDSGFAMLYVYRGNVFATAGDDPSAVREFQQALEADPALDVARRGLAAAEQRVRQRQPR